MRQKFVAGNWKMNKTRAEAVDFCDKLLDAGVTCKTVLFVPFTVLGDCVERCKGTPVAIGAQNVHWERSGAFTGEISTQMLKDVGAEYVLVGHSERRQYFGETDETVAKRLAAALGAGLKAVICVGETAAERKSGRTEQVLLRQIETGLSLVSEFDAQTLSVAYEPVWAIGTGDNATEEQAQQATAFLRKCVARIAGEQFAQQVSILYGGSMNEKNAAALMAMPDIDGGLVGGASLDAKKFSVICGTEKI